MNTTDTYTVQELRDMIATNREQTCRADRMGLRELARSCRALRRRLEDMLAEAVQS